MAKNHRGTGIRELAAHGRGTCPICKSTGIKVLYEKEIDGNTVNICKFCNANLKNKAKKAAPQAEMIFLKWELTASNFCGGSFFYESFLLYIIFMIFYS